MSLVATPNSGGGWRPVRCFALLAMALLAGAIPMARAQAQQQSAQPTVAAASARWLCLDAACRSFPDGFVDDPTHYICDNCSMWTMVLPAYGIKVYEQFQGAPQWFADDYYQVHIAASAPVASKAQMEQSPVARSPRSLLLPAGSQSGHKSSWLRIGGRPGRRQVSTGKQGGAGP